MTYDFHPGAREHGVAYGDILHALANPLAVFDADDDRVLHVGLDRAATLLEIVTIARAGDTELVIHAMPMRTSYESLIRGVQALDA